MKVRENLPQRRPNPTKTPTGDRWSQHKPDLKEDFHSHCGYCGSYDGFRHTYFEVDHFIPKDVFKSLGNISVNEYSNLVYSCKFCNNYKSSKWPSQREDISHINDEGFIDPCNKEYDGHLYRTIDGGIMWRSNLGKWMAINAFRFDIRMSAIKLLWQVNQRRKLVLEYAKILANMDERDADYAKAKEIAHNLGFEYTLLHNELIDYYNSL